MLYYYLQIKPNMTNSVTKEHSAKLKQEVSTDILERAKLMSDLQQHLQNHISGTQVQMAEMLGITQPRLNDLLNDRIDKFSLGGLVSLAKKAGLRVNVSVQNVKIHTGPVLSSQKIAPLQSTFAPGPGELGKLDSKQGTVLFLKLLRCEAIANGLGPKDVVLPPSNINVPDGGIDAKVENSPISGSLLEKGSTYYQIKTGDSFKPWQPSALKKELFGKSNATPSKNRLGSEVKNCLEQDGAYALVTFGYDLLPNQHTEIVKLLTDLFNKCGCPTPRVRVYGQGQIVGELDKYPSICLDLIGLDDAGFMSIEGWQNNAQMQGKFEYGSDRETLIKDIRAAVLENAVQHIRIIGEPGIGKTRLVLETLDDAQIRPSVIYVPTGEDFQKSKLFNELLKPDRTYSVTLVIDDCDNRDRAQIWSAIKGWSSIKLITIDHGPEETYDSAMRVYPCPQLPEEQIKNILFSYLQQQTDLTNWAKWCEGSARVAHLLGENLKSNPDDLLKSPADVPVWERYIIGHKEMASQEAEQYQTVLRHIALFQRFGFESPVSDEAKFISGLVEQVDPTITWGRFQQIVQHYRVKRILQGRHTLFIVPKALHVYLWVKFWKNYGHGLEFQSFLEQVPESMRRWFLQLFIYAEGSQEAQCVVKRILSTSGPFSDQNFLRSEFGLRFLNYLAEADPDGTLTLLERTIKTWSQEELYSWRTGRQDIVWALEKIAVCDKLFIRAINILISMALSENEHYSNNSKGTLTGLFDIQGLAATQAEPTKRFRILKDLVKSNDTNLRRLGLEMCEEWLRTRGGSRVVGPEYQGLKPAIEFWHPETYGEIFDCWHQVLQFLRTEIKGFEIHDRNEVVKRLVNAAYGFVYIEAVANEIMDILFELAEDKDIDHKPLIQFVIEHLSQSDETLDKTIFNRIRQLDKVLTGTSLWQRTIRYILSSSDLEDYKFSGGKVKESALPGKRVKNLAEEYTKDLDVFSEYIPKLVQASGHRLWELGYECGKLAKEKFDEPIVNYIEAGSPDNNPRFLGGYLAGICARNAVRYENLIHRLLHNETTRDIAVDAISKLTEAVIRELLALLKSGQLAPAAFTSKRLTDLSENLFQQIIIALLDHVEDTSSNIFCVQHVYNYYFGKDSIGDFPEDLIFKVLISIPSEFHQNSMYGFYWGKIAQGFIGKYPHRKMDLFKEITSDTKRLSRYCYSGDIGKLANDIVKDHPQETWKIISELLISQSEKYYELIFWLKGGIGFKDRSEHSIMRHMSAEDVIDWIKTDIDNRCRLIQEVLPKTLDEDAGGQLTRLFIEEFCDDERLAGHLHVHFHMGGWSGPDSIYLSGKRDAARRWMSEITSPRIQIWLGKYIEHLSNYIEKAIIKEEREF